MVADRPKQEDLDWISLRDELAALEVTQTPWDKGIQKCKDNPIVPVGCAATAAALGYGIWTFMYGSKKMSQYMMRTRVIAQAITVFAILISLNATSAKRK